MTDPTLRPTRFIDSDHPAIRAFAATHAGMGTARDKAVALAAAVRDAVPYDLYAFQVAPEPLVASAVLAAPSAYCVPKAVLLAAVARAAGIPSRIGFADVRNHLTSPRFQAMMDEPNFRWHAYTALQIDGRWLKATPAFDQAMCAKRGVAVLTFDGTQDSIFQPFDAQGRKSMEYIAFHGEFDDLPYDRFASEMRRIYPRLLANVANVRAERAGPWPGLGPAGR